MISRPGISPESRSDVVYEYQEFDIHDDASSALFFVSFTSRRYFYAPAVAAMSVVTSRLKKIMLSVVPLRTAMLVPEGEVFFIF